MADPPKKKTALRKPEFVLTVWREPTEGTPTETAKTTWCCRLKSLRDGTESLLSDISELPHFLADWPEWSAPEVNHAQA